MGGGGGVQYMMGNHWKVHSRHDVDSSWITSEKGHCLQCGNEAMCGVQGKPHIIVIQVKRGGDLG